MADARNLITISFTTTLALTEVECRALDGITGYGVAAFLSVFKEKLGAAYIRDHEAGVHSLFKAIGRDVSPALREIDQTRKDLAEAITKREGKITP